MTLPQICVASLFNRPSLANVWWQYKGKDKLPHICDISLQSIRMDCVTVIMRIKVK